MVSKVHLVDGYKGAFTNFRAPLIRALGMLGHTVFVSAPELDRGLVDKLRGDGVIPIPIWFDRVGINPFKDMFGLISIVVALRKSKPDILLAYSSKAIIYGAFAGRLVGVPVRAAFVTGLGYAFVNRSFRGRLAAMSQRLLYRLALRLCHVVFFQNPDDLREFRRLGLLRPSQNALITNGSGVEIDKFSQEAVPSETVFLMIGRLLNGKGVIEYCEAALRLKKDYPEVKFILAGWLDSENPDSISPRLYDEIKSGEGVTFLGRLSDVRAALAECSVFVLPSYREGTPRSTLEALSTGRAIITCDSPGCRETVVDGSNGFLVRVGDVESLVVAMQKYIHNPGLARLHGQASRRIAESKYDVRSVNHEIIRAVGLRQ